MRLSAKEGVSLPYSPNPQVTDILIVGGGLVGASLALALSASTQSNKENLQITLVESKKITSLSQPSFDDRSTVLAKSSANLLSDIGLWESIKSTPIKHIHTSDQGRFGLSRLHAEDYQLDAMGYVIDNRSLGTALYSELDKYPNIERLIPATVDHIVAHDAYYKCHISSNEHRANSKEKTTNQTALCYHAKLVVLCDGGRSNIANSLGLSEHVQEYQQAALIANIALDRPHSGWAYERFTPQGPIAMLPLSTHQGSNQSTSFYRSALVWTTPMALLDQRLALSDDAFLSELQTQFGYRLGRLKQVGERTSYPLKIQKVEELIRSRLAVLGNAAHTLHPVAGQGFNLALRGAFLLASTVLNAHKTGNDIGSYSVLKQYEHAQIQDRDRIQQASHALISIFGNQNNVIGVGRNLAVLALDNCPLLKAEFAHSAMGLDVTKPNFRFN